MSVDREVSADRTRAVLEGLTNAGVRGFDAAGVHLVEALLRRAGDLPGPAGDRLQARAEARVHQLTTTFEAARRRAEAALARVPGDAPDRECLLRALGEGELAMVVRAARRHSEAPRRPRADVASAQRRAQDAAARYERACNGLTAAIEIARALDTVSDMAGPYNPLSLAARALGELAELAPAYVRAQIDRLEDLGALLALPAERTARSRRPRK